MIEYDPYAYEMHEDPYPVYTRLRAEAPLYRNEALDFFAFSRHADVLAAFRDTDRFTNTEGVSVEPSARQNAELGLSFLAMDPPRHTRMRALISAGFTPRRVSAMEPRIRALARQRLDKFPSRGQGSCDFVAELAGKLPMDVISEMLGVPEADRDELRAWADLLVHREEGVRDVPRAGVEAFGKLRAYFVDLVADRERHPGSDLISALLGAELEGQRLEPNDLYAFCNLMVVAGNETTTKLLANAIYWLWRNPDQRALVLEDRGLIPRWVEETLRYDNSTQVIARTVCADVELHGGKLCSGDRVLLLIGSANRDERVIERPDAYDVRRNTTNMLSFGQGAHFCLGASLARLEARVTLEEFLARHPDYAVEPDGIERVHSVNVRGFAKLPLAL